MGGRILVVDDLEPNRRLLEVRLGVEDYQVTLAASGTEALVAVEAAPPDLILLDVMMPGMDGFEVCKRLKSDPSTAHIPIMLLTALSEHHDRLHGLQVGADDFLSKPWDDRVMIARVRSLLRLKGVIDQLSLREETGQALREMSADERERVGTGARILIIDDPSRAAERLARRLEDSHRPRLETDTAAALRSARWMWDLVVVNVAATGFDGQSLIKQLHREETTRHLPVLAVIDAGARDALVAALENGASDVIERPIDSQELAARVRSLVRHRRYADFLRERLDVSLSDAALDQLTQLVSPRFAESQLRSVMTEASREGYLLSAAVFDVDAFHDMNARFGHAGGDRVLQAVAACLQRVLPDYFVIGRRPGDEFLVIMAGASLDEARDYARAARDAICRQAVTLDGPNDGVAQTVGVSVSVGATQFHPADTMGAMLDRLERALAAAKERGGNRVVTAVRKSQSTRQA